MDIEEAALGDLDIGLRHGRPAPLANHVKGDVIAGNMTKLA
jgi:hypothetical protein